MNQSKRNRTIMTFSQYRLGRVILVVDGFIAVLLGTPVGAACSTEGSAPGNPRAPAPGHIGSIGLPNMALGARPMPASELMLGVGTGGGAGAELVMLPLVVVVVGREVDVASAARGTGGVLPPEAGASFFSSSFFLVSDVDIFQKISAFEPSTVNRQSLSPDYVCFLWSVLLHFRRLQTKIIGKSPKTRTNTKNSNFLNFKFSNTKTSSQKLINITSFLALCREQKMFSSTLLSKNKRGKSHEKGTYPRWTRASIHIFKKRGSHQVQQT